MAIEPKVVTASEPIGEVVKITQPIKQQNVAGAQINPATEDTLSARASEVTVAKLMPTTVIKYVLALVLADIEYIQSLPANTKKFRVHLRDYAAFRLAYVMDKVAASTDPFETIPAGSEKYEDNLIMAALTLYLASPVANKIAEIETWS